MASWRNWSGSVRSRPRLVLRPASEAELAAALPAAPRPLRVAGSGHSFTPLCATGGTLVLLDRLTGVIDHDAERSEATVYAGTPIHELGRLLHARGTGLVNQGDIDRQTIGGATGTGTHGTGQTLGSLSTAVTAVRLVCVDGRVIDADAKTRPDILAAAQVSLGALGIITRLRLRCRPAYRLAEREWTMPAADAVAAFDTFAMRHRHFEFFWFPYAERVICKALDETGAPAPEPRGSSEGDAMSGRDRLATLLFEAARRAPFLSAPVQRLFTDEIARTLPGAPPGEAKVRWSHEAFPSPRPIRFNEMEYALPREQGLAALRALVERIRAERLRTAFPVEVRTVAGDGIPLSPFHGRDSMTIAVHQYRKQSYRRYFREAEAIFRAHGGRPHWGKLHTLTARELEPLYPRWADFTAVRKVLDPEGAMLNAHLSSLFWTPGR